MVRFASPSIALCASLPPIANQFSALFSSPPLPHKGIKLRKVEKQNHEAKENDRNKGLHDVASILARRVAIELSESESSESDDDSEGWQETNETSA